MSPKPRVLIVDDDTKVSAELVRSLTARCVLRVGVASSAVQALDYLNAAPNGFEVLVADLRLPGIPGPSLLALAAERWPAMRRVLYTGADVTGLDVPYADAILHKGGPLREISDKVCELANAPREPIGPRDTK